MAAVPTAVTLNEAPTPSEILAELGISIETGFESLLQTLRAPELDDKPVADAKLRYYAWKGDSELFPDRYISHDDQLRLFNDQEKWALIHQQLKTLRRHILGLTRWIIESYSVSTDQLGADGISREDLEEYKGQVIKAMSGNIEKIASELGQGLVQRKDARERTTSSPNADVPSPSFAEADEKIGIEFENLYEAFSTPKRQQLDKAELDRAQEKYKEWKESSGFSSGSLHERMRTDSKRYLEIIACMDVVRVWLKLSKMVPADATFGASTDIATVAREMGEEYPVSLEQPGADLPDPDEGDKLFTLLRSNEVKQVFAINVQLVDVLVLKLEGLSSGADKSRDIEKHSLANRLLFTL